MLLRRLSRSRLAQVDAAGAPPACQCRRPCEQQEQFARARDAGEAA